MEAYRPNMSKIITLSTCGGLSDEGRVLLKTYRWPGGGIIMKVCLLLSGCNGVLFKSGFTSGGGLISAQGKEVEHTVASMISSAITTGRRSGIRGRYGGIH